MTTYNTNLILESELKQVALDLISQIDMPNAVRILVYGGLPQDATLLASRWPDAQIIQLSEQEEVLLNMGTYDLIFSNSALQYKSYQARLITQLFSLVKDDGILAVSVPNALNMPIHVQMESIAQEKKWVDFYKNIAIHYYVPAYYYEIVAPLCSKIRLWETYDQHIFFHYQEIVHLYAETEMKVYMDALPNDELRSIFTESLIDLLPAEYKRQSNQAILFPYRRTFFIAKK